MTENEALKYMRLFRDDWDRNSKTKNAEALDVAIKAIEEIQQYRAIGTVEQLKTMLEGFWKLKDLCEEYEKYGLPEDYWKLNEMCKEYSAIGTIEELQALKEDGRFLEFLYNHILPNEMEQYLSMYKSSDIKTNGE